MKPAGLPLLAFVLTGSPVDAAEPVAPVSPKISSRLIQEIQATLPKYSPPPKVLDQPKPLDTDPDVLALPKFTVKEYRPRDHDPDVWMTGRGVQQKAMAAYKQSMTDLEWALNSWFIPLVTPPASVRARAHYQNTKLGGEITRLNNLINQIAQQDPAASAELRQELKNMVEGRPVGSK